MKKMKKLMALVIAAVMTVSMAAAVFAEDSTTTTEAAATTTTYKISMSIDSTDTHQYKVYQIFTGSLETAADGSTVLTNIKYGKNYGSTGTAVADSVIDGITDADAFARSIAASLSGDPVGTLKAGAAELTVTEPGYYLIVDDTSIALGDGDAYSAYMVEVVGTVTLTPKKDTTEVDKKITKDTLGKDTVTESGTTDAENTINGDTDNVSIGDTVTYEITGTVPSHATDYDYYYYIIGDTLDEGLTFNNDVVVTATSADGKTKTLAADTDYKLYTGTDSTDKKTYADGKTFQVALTDAKSLAGYTIKITYTAELNEKAKIGEDPNENTVTIKYSNNPNYDYDGDKDDDTPGKPDSTKTTPMGETPEDKTYTYTTAIEIQKVDEEGNPLTGAEFTITGDSVEIVMVSSETFTEDSKGTYYKLTDGTYTTEEPVNADYMKEAEAGATAGYVEDSTYTGDDKVTIGTKVYRPYDSSKDSGKTVYILVKKNSDAYSSTTQKYSKTETWTAKDTDGKDVTATAEVGADGVVTFKGLGAGTYTITETKTPSGYNTIDPLTVDISFKADTKEGEVHWSTKSSDASYNSTTGRFEIEIENKKGTNLPTTGGVGTTLFYLIGTILILGAGIILVMRRRAAAR